MIPNIEDLTEEPIVGKIYLVPCVEITIKIAMRIGIPSGVYPIQGPGHTDKEHIGFDVYHWHYDARFLSSKQLIWMSSWRHAIDAVFTQPLCDRLKICAKPVLHRRRCNRLMPEVPFAKYKPDSEFWLKTLEDAYTDKRVTCGKCPHRGLPLLSLPREPGTNNIICPGHGLKFDITTGKLVRQCD